MNDTLEEKREKRKKIYRDVYEEYDYGGSFFGREAIGSIVAPLEMNHILDVGCGQNQFAKFLREKYGIEAIGTDLIGDYADYSFPAHDLSFFESGAFDWLTSFDVLEHLLPEELDEVLEEWRRVASKGWLFSISYRPSEHDSGYDLHTIVQPQKWWIAKLGSYIYVRKKGNYLFGRFK